MKFLFIFASIFLATSVSAAELILVIGFSDGTCSTADSEILQSARQAAEKKLPSQDYVQISKWNERAYEREEFGVCRSKQGWAEAAFVKKSEVNEKWYLTLTEGYSNKRIDENDPGKHYLTDEEAWAAALKAASDRVSLFCKPSQETPTVLSRSKKIFPDASWYDYFEITAKFGCSVNAARAWKTG